MILIFRFLLKFKNTNELKKIINLYCSRILRKNIWKFFQKIIEIRYKIENNTRNRKDRILFKML